MGTDRYLKDPMRGGAARRRGAETERGTDDLDPAGRDVDDCAETDCWPSRLLLLRLELAVLRFLAQARRRGWERNEAVLEGILIQLEVSLMMIRSEIDEWRWVEEEGDEALLR